MEYLRVPYFSSHLSFIFLFKPLMALKYHDGLPCWHNCTNGENFLHHLQSNFTRCPTGLLKEAPKELPFTSDAFGLWFFLYDDYVKMNILSSWRTIQKFKQLNTSEISYISYFQYTGFMYFNLLMHIQWNENVWVHWSVAVNISVSRRWTGLQRA